MDIYAELQKARRLRVWTTCLLTLLTGWAAFQALGGHWIWFLVMTGLALFNGFLLARQTRTIHLYQDLYVRYGDSRPVEPLRGLFNGHP